MAGLCTFDWNCMLQTKWQEYKKIELWPELYLALLWVRMSDQSPATSDTSRTVKAVNDFIYFAHILSSDFTFVV